jgi:transcriptional antiterminator NusG
MTFAVEPLSATNDLPWFAVQTRSRYENFASNHLRGIGYQVFLPSYKCQRRWSDRIKESELPLFPGYLFCRFDPYDRFPILATPGVIQVVGIGKKPVPVDDTEITEIQTLVRSGLQGQPCPFLQVGHRVKIEHGPLRGVEGILLRFRGGQRLVLSVTLLQRSVAVQTSEAWVTPMPSDQRAFSGSVSRRLSAQRQNPKA